MGGTVTGTTAGVDRTDQVQLGLTLGVALFDLDQTLLAGDSEHLWGTFLAHRTGADAAIHEQESQRFYDEYLAGRLDFDAYMRFRLEPMAAIEAKQLLFWRDRYIGEIIEQEKKHYRIFEGEFHHINSTGYWFDLDVIGT